MAYVATNLAEFLRQFIHSQQTLQELDKQYKELEKKLQDPQYIKSLQQASTLSQPSSQPPKVIKQPFKVIRQPFYDFHSGTMEGVINPLTGEFYVPPKVFPSSGEASQTASQPQKTTSTKPKTAQKATAKKPLTAETIGQTAGVQSPIPVLPYTPEGLISALSQGKISLPQAQQILKNIAQNELSGENIYDKIYKEIQKMPEEIQKDLKELESKLENIDKQLKENRDKQVSIQQKYADRQMQLIEKQLDLITNIFTDLMKEKPSLEPDKWTEFGRRLAMALGAISALAHPQYAPYFYMAIPQIVQYWQNEDLQNFEKAMRKFELALKLAGTQLDFYNEIFEKNLAILEKKKEVELLPLIVTEKQLMDKYYTISDAYTKMAGEVAKAISDKIGHLLTLADLKEKHRHYRAIEEIQRMAKEIMLWRTIIYEQYTRASLGIRNAILNLMKKKHELIEEQLKHPEKFPKLLIPPLTSKAKTPQDVAKILSVLIQHQNILDALNLISSMSFSDLDLGL
jgi:tetratricopeptide (TPR) repeat protein